MKSAGPKNIGYAAAVTEDSAEGFSAMLERFRNPEVEQLKTQTELIKQSVAVQKDINRGIEEFNKSKHEVDFAA